MRCSKLLFVLITLSGIYGESRLVSQQSTPPSLIAPGADTVNQNLVRLVVVTFKVEGQELKQVDAKMVSASRRAQKEWERNGPIEIEALRSDKSLLSKQPYLVLKTSAPYEEINVAEHGGLVKIKPQMLTFSLPVGQPFDTLRIKLPGHEHALEFKFYSFFHDFCDHNLLDAWCQPNFSLE